MKCDDCGRFMRCMVADRVVPGLADDSKFYIAENQWWCRKCFMTVMLFKAHAK